MTVPLPLITNSSVLWNAFNVVNSKQQARSDVLNTCKLCKGDYARVCSIKFLSTVDLNPSNDDCMYWTLIVGCRIISLWSLTNLYKYFTDMNKSKAARSARNRNAVLVTPQLRASQFVWYFSRNRRVIVLQYLQCGHRFHSQGQLVRNIWIETFTNWKRQAWPVMSAMRQSISNCRPLYSESSLEANSTNETSTESMRLVAVLSAANSSLYALDDANLEVYLEENLQGNGIMPTIHHNWGRTICIKYSKRKWKALKLCWETWNLLLLFAMR